MIVVNMHVCDVAAEQVAQVSAEQANRVKTLKDLLIALREIRAQRSQPTPARRHLTPEASVS